MRITVGLDENLVHLARREPSQRGTTLSALIEQGLRQVLAQSRPRPARRARVILPVSKAGGGMLPAVDLNNSAALLDIMEGRR